MRMIKLTAYTSGLPAWINPERVTVVNEVKADGKPATLVSFAGDDALLVAEATQFIIDKLSGPH